MIDDSTCFKCGANAWTACKHRPAQREKPVFVEEPESLVEKHRRVSGGGLYRIRR